MGNPFLLLGSQCARRGHATLLIKSKKAACGAGSSLKRWGSWSAYVVGAGGNAGRGLDTQQVVAGIQLVAVGTNQARQGLGEPVGLIVGVGPGGTGAAGDRLGQAQDAVLRTGGVGVVARGLVEPAVVDGGELAIVKVVAVLPGGVPVVGALQGAARQLVG